jgi:PAS domain S-box-containing protein
MSEHWYCDVVELSQDAIYVWGDGCFVFANRATARLFGIESPQELIGRRVFDFVHPDSIPITQGRLDKLLADGELLAPQELKMIRSDGRVYRCRSRGDAVQLYRLRQPAHAGLSCI